jgi:hypothetical protein
MLATQFTVHRRCVAALLVITALAACRDSAPPTGVSGAVRGGSLAHVTAGPPVLETFYGPERFTRDKGKPADVTRHISTVGFAAPFVLHVRNGDTSSNNRISSATVSLNGVTLLGPSAFNQHAGEWTFMVTLDTGATLVVSLASKPGSFLDIWIEGTPVPTTPQYVALSAGWKGSCAIRTDGRP